MLVFNFDIMTIGMKVGLKLSCSEQKEHQAPQAIASSGVSISSQSIFPRKMHMELNKYGRFEPLQHTLQ